jgi:uncharacterized FlgJ-related protein
MIPEIQKSKELNKKNVYNKIKELNIKHPKIVLKQSILETGWFKSKVSKTHNNIFGFRTSKGYIKFDSWEQCVEYYAKWQKRKYRNGDYYEFLVAKNYAEDSLYISKLKSIKI